MCLYIVYIYLIVAFGEHQHFDYEITTRLYNWFFSETETILTKIHGPNILIEY